MSRICTATYSLFIFKVGEINFTNEQSRVLARIFVAKIGCQFIITCMPMNVKNEIYGSLVLVHPILQYRSNLLIGILWY